MKKIFTTFFLIFTLSVFVCYSQDKTIDSLKIVFKTSKEDTNKVKALLEITKHLWRTGNYDTSITYAEKAKTFAKKITYKAGIANAYSNLGIIYWYQGNYPSAIENHEAALVIRNELGDKKGKAGSYNNIGLIYNEKGNFPEALKNYFLALKINEEIGNDSWASNNYNNIGNICALQGDYKAALKYHLSALKIREKQGDKLGMSTSYNCIGSILSDQSNYPEAIENYHKALVISTELNDANAMSISYDGIGTTFFRQGNYKEALNYFVKVMKICEEIGDKLGIARAYGSLGVVETLMDKNIDAKKNFESSIFLAKEVGGLIEIRDGYQGLAVVDSSLENYKDAFEHNKLYIAYRDSINNVETTKKSVEQQMQYIFEKKEVETKANQKIKDAVVTTDKKRQKTVLFLVSGVLLLVIIFTVFVFRTLRLTRKQNTIIELQKNLVEEKHKEITDSINYAERIQRSFIATKELLDNNLNDYFILFKPKDIVSGDFYWAAKLLNGNFALVTADSTGHGVPGAIMSLLNVTSLEKAVEELSQPAEIFDATRKTIIERLKNDGSAEGGKDGMDASITVYDFKNKKIIIAAANNPIWIVREKEIIEIRPDKMPIGKHDKQNVPFSQQEFELQTGNVIYTLTDGFPDQFGGEKGKKFMIKNLRELIFANAHLSMNEQKQILEATFKNWLGNLEQVDDVTLIGIRV